MGEMNPKRSTKTDSELKVIIKKKKKKTKKNLGTKITGPETLKREVFYEWYTCTLYHNPIIISRGILKACLLRIFRIILLKMKKRDTLLWKEVKNIKSCIYISCLLLSFLGIHRGRKRGLLPAFAGKGHKLEKRWFYHKCTVSMPRKKLCLSYPSYSTPINQSIKMELSLKIIQTLFSNKEPFIFNNSKLSLNFNKTFANTYF